MSVLVDLGALAPGACNHALDGLYKSIGESGPDIWAPHENPYIRELVEWFTKRGLDRNQQFQDELLHWLDGSLHLPGLVLSRPNIGGAWTPDNIEEVVAYLKSRSSFDLEDCVLLCDYLAHKYTGDEAEWLTTRAALLGRAQMHGVPEALIARVAVILPTTVAEATRLFPFSPAGKAILEYGAWNAAELVVEVGDRLRHGIKMTVMRHVMEKQTGDRLGDGKLQQELFDQFAAANRDWRRIAVTEAGEMANQGLIMSLPPGTMVRRIEQYYGACAWCKKIDGRLFKVVSPDDPNKNGETDVWVGKTNVGRSASPYKRTDEGLVQRTPSELYWVAAGTQHPHCRGQWQPMTDPGPNADLEFAAFIRTRLGQHVGV